jgi:hypothetical protein
MEINDHLHILIPKPFKHLNKIDFLLPENLQKLQITIKHIILRLLINLSQQLYLWQILLPPPCHDLHAQTNTLHNLFHNLPIFPTNLVPLTEFLEIEIQLPIFKEGKQQESQQPVQGQTERTGAGRRRGQLLDGTH